MQNGRDLSIDDDGCIMYHEEGFGGVLHQSEGRVLEFSWCV